MSNLMSVREVADRFGVTTTSVYDWIKKGDLDVVVIGKIAQRKYVPEESVMLFESRKKREASSDDASGGLTPYVATA